MFWQLAYHSGAVVTIKNRIVLLYLAVSTVVAQHNLVMQE